MSQRLKHLYCCNKQKRSLNIKLIHLSMHRSQIYIHLLSCSGLWTLKSSYLDWHGLCGAVQSSPQRIFNSVNALVSVTRHLNV